MRILFLGDSYPLVEWLGGRGNHVVNEPIHRITKERLQTAKFTGCEHAVEIIVRPFDYLISYNYKYILDKEVLDLFPDSTINLHISMLPWNKGRHPNFWSLIDATPKGVTIHRIDEGVNTGNILAQKEVGFRLGDTLRTSYYLLQDEIQKLFMSYWDALDPQWSGRKQAKDEGSYHRGSDIEFLFGKLSNGWDTPVGEVEDMGAEVSMSRQFTEEQYEEIKLRKENQDKSI